MSFNDEEPLYPDWFLQSNPGNPLPDSIERGVGQWKHRGRWQAVLRRDPCAYCGRRPAGTIDHIVSKILRKRTHSAWIDYTGACKKCNGRKKSKGLLEFLLEIRPDDSASA